MCLNLYILSFNENSQSVKLSIHKIRLRVSVNTKVVHSNSGETKKI